MEEKGLISLESIKGLKVNGQAKLLEGQKSRFIKIIEEEWNNHRTRHQMEEQALKQKVLNEYKETSGWNKMMKAYNVLEGKKDALDKKLQEMRDEMLNKTGLNLDGLPSYMVKSTSEAHASHQRVANLLNNAIKSTDFGTLKNKIIARMLVCETVGEAMVIMRGVLGNGVIPSE